MRSAIHHLIQKEEVHERYLHATTTPLYKPEAYLRLAVHSPVAISLTNTKGERVARIGTTTHTEVPNSYYLTLGEGKYLGVPLDGEEYTITLAGTGEGRFTFELVEEREGSTHTTRTFTDVPVTPYTRATLTLDTLEEGSDTLTLDEDGDGVADRTVYAQEYTPPASFSLLREKIAALHTKAKRMLLRRTHLAEWFAKRGRVKLAVRTLHTLDRQVKWLSTEKAPRKLRIPKDSAREIRAIIHELQEVLQSNNT